MKMLIDVTGIIIRDNCSRSLVFEVKILTGDNLWLFHPFAA